MYARACDLDEWQQVFKFICTNQRLIKIPYSEFYYMFKCALNQL